MENKIDALIGATQAICANQIDVAKDVIKEKYPFHPFVTDARTYTDAQKMEQFYRDGFIDRYSGQKLINPGLMRVLSRYLPNEFPFQKNWKMSECHIAYWEFVPTVDHIYPIALGGADDETNWASTSMMHNHIKSSWTLEQLNWKLYPAGLLEEWDGLTSKFIDIVDNDESLLEDTYIKHWYKLSIKMMR